uniref:Stress-response A/B barrel domain-containing protein n=1 Tax=Photinus pyralis TaxID=7054 RepID=A0A1Y1MKS9_PHOPY
MSRHSPRILLRLLANDNSVALRFCPSSTPLKPSAVVCRRHHSRSSNTPPPSSFQSIKMADRVHRVTMIKLPNPAAQQKLIDAYKTVDATNQKDGKPYILSLAVGVAEEDPRAQGYTVVCKTEFASMDDLKYYDESCAAHKNLKATAKELGVEGVMTVFFKPQLWGRSA